MDRTFALFGAFFGFQVDCGREIRSMAIESTLHLFFHSRLYSQMPLEAGVHGQMLPADRLCFVSCFIQTAQLGVNPGRMLEALVAQVHLSSKCPEVLKLRFVW